MFTCKAAPKSTWINRVIAALAVVNLGLIAFDWSYIPWRDFYLRYLPGFTEWYGETFKGIERNRDTEAYLNLVDEWIAASDNVERDRLLAELRRQSEAMVDENPFEVANKTGTLERIKNRMRDRFDTESSKAAFREFWSRSHIEEVGREEAIAFFDSDIRPLIETNYFRGIGENGQPIDRFWQIDLPFVIIFLADFLIRTLGISRRYNGTNWFDAMLWRWYDVPLFLPFWRWLRVLPTTVRIHESRLMNLEPVRDRLSRGIAASFAIELTEVVVLRIIEQMQDLIQNEDVVQALINATNRRRYVDLNGVDEAEQIARRVTTLTVYQILPGIRPQIEALIRYSVACVLEQSPVYRNLTTVPGFKEIPEQLGERLVRDVTQTAYDSLTTALENPEGLELIRQLVAQFNQTLQTQVPESEAVEEIETLMVDLLEELKINYVKNLSEKDLESLREETHHRLYEITQQPKSQMVAIRPQKMRDRQAR